VESSPSQSYIEQQVKVFIDRGYDAYLGSVTKEDKTFYRLRVGKYSDRNEAVRVSAEINSMYNLQSWVDKGSW
jgi:cell division septation protein DedD